jgi:hypothetical protein
MRLFVRELSVRICRPFAERRAKPIEDRFEAPTVGAKIIAVDQNLGAAAARSAAPYVITFLID